MNHPRTVELSTPETSISVLSRLGADQSDVTELVEAVLPFNTQIRTRAFLERVDSRNKHGESLPSEYAVRFEALSDRELALIHPQHIPALIDALTLMHRQWLLDLNGD